MRLWQLLAFAILVAAVGHLIYIFQEAEPTEITPYVGGPQRHVMIEADYFPILCDALIVVLIVSGFVGGVKLRKTPRIPDEDYNWWAVILMRIGMFALILAFYVFFLRRKVENREFLSIFEGLRRMADPQGTMGGFILSEPTAFDQFIVIMLSLMIIVIIIMIIVLMFRPKQPTGEEPILIPFSEYSWKKREYTFDGDPRDVVINAYGAALDTLNKKGVHVPEHLTPWEFQKEVGSPHLCTLTQLFERARYSAHDITRRDSDEALDEFRSIQQEGLDVPDRIRM